MWGNLHRCLLFQSLPASPPPQWLRFSLQSFHTVVLDEPVYWLVALSARACLRDFLLRELLSSERGRDILLLSGSEEKANSCSQEWREESLKEVTWTQRYKIPLLPLLHLHAKLRTDALTNKKKKNDHVWLCGCIFLCQSALMFVTLLQKTTR